MSVGFFESVAENAALACLEALGYAALYGSGIALDAPGAGRCDPNCHDDVLP